MPCRLFVAQYLYNIHMRWLQYLRVRNSKYIQFKGLDNSRLHVAGRDTVYPLILNVREVKYI